MRKYRFIFEHRRDYRLIVMCRVLGNSRSGYYAWVKRRPSRREQMNAALLVKIRDAFKRSKERYGSPRVWQDLRAEGIRCGKNRIARLMRQERLVALVGRRFKITTRRNTAVTNYAPDRLQRQFVASRPNEVWTSDITYIWTKEGWLYLAVILDIFSRSVVGWATSARLKADIVCDALQRALYVQRPQAPLIMHSDRGRQYTSEAVSKILADHKTTILVSHAYSCYDNAITETFFHTLKSELVWWERYQTRREAHRSLFEYIEIFYNRKRRHSALGGRSPHDVKNNFTP